MKKTKVNMIETGKKIGIICFLGGWIFGQTPLAAVGAVIWGGLTLYEFFKIFKK